MEESDITFKIRVCIFTVNNNIGVDLLEAAFKPLCFKNFKSEILKPKVKYYFH